MIYHSVFIQNFNPPCALVALSATYQKDTDTFHLPRAKEWIARTTETQIIHNERSHWSNAVLVWLSGENDHSMGTSVITYINMKLIDHCTHYHCTSWQGIPCYKRRLHFLPILSPWLSFIQYVNIRHIGCYLEVWGMMKSKCMCNGNISFLSLSLQSYFQVNSQVKSDGLYCKYPDVIKHWGSCSRWVN